MDAWDILFFLFFIPPVVLLAFVFIDQFYVVHQSILEPLERASSTFTILFFVTVPAAIVFFLFYKIFDFEGLLVMAKGGAAIATGLFAGFIFSLFLFGILEQLFDLPTKERHLALNKEYFGDEMSHSSFWRREGMTRQEANDFYKGLFLESIKGPLVLFSHWLGILIFVPLLLIFTALAVGIVYSIFNFFGVTAKNIIWGVAVSVLALPVFLGGYMKIHKMLFYEMIHEIRGKALGFAITMFFLYTVLSALANH